MDGIVPDPPSRPLRAGILGAGSISRAHAAGYLAAGADLVAIADPDADAAARRAEAYGIGAVYADAAAMFADAALDVVSVATPVSTHHDLVLAAAEAGVHVLCEKPIALDLAQADAMIEAAAAAGVTLQVGHQMRSDAAIQRAHALIASGAIGDVAFVRLRQAHDWGGATEVRPSFQTRASGGGGTLLDNGVHLMDLARHLAGDVEEVYARIATRRWPVELEDTAHVSLRFASGALGSVETSWSATGWEEGFWVYGSAGALEWTNRHADPVLVRSSRASGGRDWATTDVARETFAAPKSHTAQVAAFLAAVRGEGVVPATGTDGREAVRLVLAAYDSAGRGLPVTVGEEASDLRAAMADVTPA